MEMINYEQFYKLINVTTYITHFKLFEFHTN